MFHFQNGRKHRKCTKKIEVIMMSVHRDVPCDRDVSISFKKAWKS